MPRPPALDPRLQVKPLTRVLLVRPDGIGDQILCLPVASALRRLVPGIHVSFLSSAYAAPVLHHHPAIDEVLPVTGCERFGELVALFRGGFDAAIFLKPFRRLMIAAWVARVPTRVATGYRWYSMFANRRVYEHRHDFSKHESEYNLGLLKGLGLSADPDPPLPALTLTDTEKHWARAQLEAMPHPLVVVHPGGFQARRWPADYYGSLIKQLASAGCGVVLTGSEDEGKRFIAETSFAAMEGVKDLMGKISLRQLMAVIAGSDAVVAGSTGPIHIAAALSCPVVSPFDPRRCALPIRWQPLGKGIVLRPDVPTCEKCVYEACPYWDCMRRISVDQVADRVRQVLECAEPLQVIHV